MEGGSTAGAKTHLLEPMDAARIALVALSAIAQWFGLLKPLGGIDLLPIAVALIGGYPILREAFSALVARRMTMELSMTIAIVAAFAIGESLTGLMIILFVLVAEVLEHMTISRGRSAIGDLLALLLAATVQTARAPKAEAIAVPAITVRTAPHS